MSFVGGVSGEDGCLDLPFFVYILQSQSTTKYYCGQTDNLVFRLGRHNNAEVKSTKHGVPWLCIKSIEVGTRSEALQLEKTIKKRGIGRWLLENGQ